MSEAPLDDDGHRPPAGDLYMLPPPNGDRGPRMSDGTYFRERAMPVGSGYWALTEEFLRYENPLVNGSPAVYKRMWKWWRVACSGDCPPPANPIVNVVKIVGSGVALAGSIVTGNAPGAVAAGLALVGSIREAASS